MQSLSPGVIILDSCQNGAHWVEILHRTPSQKSHYHKKRLNVTIMNPKIMGNINLDIFVHIDNCRLKNGNFKTIKIVENCKKCFALMHLSSQGMFQIAIFVKNF